MDAILRRAMTIHNISAYLQCFDTIAPPDAVLPPDDAKEMESGAGETRAAPEIDADSLRRELEEAFGMRMAAERKAHEQAMLLAREQWSGEEAREVSLFLKQALEAALAELRADIARVLTPVISRLVAEKAIDELVHAVRRVLADERAPVLKLAGPGELIEKVALALHAEAIAIEKTQSDAVDVSVDLSATRIQTRLRAWRRQLTNSGIDEA
jgi:hypothetical protein